MAIIITYDIPEKHRELKNAMFQLGYSDSTKDDDNRTIYLPNTTLYHSSKTALEAREDALAQCNKLGVDLERCISTNWDGWAGILGEPFA